jgi:hypothetical protein
MVQKSVEQMAPCANSLANPGGLGGLCDLARNLFVAGDQLISRKARQERQVMQRGLPLTAINCTRIAIPVLASDSRLVIPASSGSDKTDGRRVRFGKD